MKQFTIFNQLTAMPKRLAMVLTVLFTLGVGSMWGAEYETPFTITSDAVVNNSGYTKYAYTDASSRGWIITYGGNNKSVGTNNSNRNNCKLTNYSKYAVSPVTTSSIASAFVSTTSLTDIGKISYTLNGGKNQTSTKVYLIYSSDNNTFSQISLSTGTQGATISSGTSYTFAKKTGYFGLLFVATNQSGDWRIDDVNISFYKEKESTPTHTITAQSNNTSYGTVSLNGTTITASPKTGYRVSTTTPYTISPSNSAKVTQSENKFTVTPTANCTITINFEAKPKYTVNFNAGSGTCDTSFRTESTAGAGVTLPTATICDGWEFAGWTTSSVANETTDAPATLLDAESNYKPTSNCTLYAVYSRIEGGSGGGTTSVTGELSFASTAQRVSQTSDKQVWSNNGITFTNNKANSSTNVADYSNPVRLYKSSSITITAPGNITQIKFNCVSSYVISITGASTSGTTVTVALDGTSDTYTISSLSAQVRLNSISVTYTTSGGSSSTTYYNSTPQCADPCASLAAPFVTATNITSNSFTLSWNAVDGATSYNVYNYTTEDMYETTSTSYTFSGLDANTTYEWVIEAAKGTCYKSTIGTTTTSVALTPLNAPSNLRETIDCAGVSLAWDAVSGASKYEYTLNGTSTQIDKSSTSVYITPVTAGKTYTWTVKAIGDGMTYSDSPDAATRTFTSYYSVTYNLNGGSWNPVCENSCAVGGTFTICSTEPTKDGCNFVGWSTADDTEAEYQAGGTINNVSANTTLYAVWEAIPTYTVTFDSDGGSAVTTQTIEEGKTATTPSAPTKAGHTFIGWYNGDTEFDFNTPITGNITLKAKWTINQYKVTLNPNYPDGKTGTFKDKGGNTVSGDLVLTYDYNTASMEIKSLYTSLTLDGYEFGGWHNAKGANPGEVSGSKCTITGTITGNKTYYAKWSKLYSITLSENGTTKELDAQTSTSYTLPTELTAGGSCQDDTKELVGWSTDAIPNPGDKPTSNFYELGAKVTLTADQTTFYAVFATVEETTGGTIDATLSFANTQNRVSHSDSKHVWAQNDITFTNNKASSTSDVNDAYNPIRCYKNSSITITHTSNEITKIVFDCNGTNEASHISDLISPLENSGTGTVTTSDDIITITFNKSQKSFTFNLSSGQVRLDGITVTTGGGTTTTYSEYTTTCVKLPDPVLSFATEPANPIEFTDVACGGNSSKQSVTVVGENLRDVVNVSVTGPYKIARTASTAVKDFTTSLTLDKTAAGAIHDNYKTVYIISTPPAQSTEATTGTLTFTTTKGNTLTVNLSTPTVNCTTYALTFNDRGNKTVENYYAGVKVPQPADPTGVCTDPIHYVFDGWAERTVANGSTEYTKVTFPYTMPGQNKTLYAVYRYLTSGGNGDYNLVTSALDDWSGDYLIAYNNETFADGTIGGEDGIGKLKNKVDLSSYISGSTIPATEGDKYNVTLETVTGGYVLKTKDGKYNYYTTNESNGISVSTKNTADDYPITVKFVSQEEINLCLTGKAVGSVLRYNTTGYFRFYKNGGQEPVHLYKKASGTTLYTSAPVCGPLVEITSDKDIYVTGGKGVHSTVVAQKKITFSATRLQPNAGGNAPSIKVPEADITLNGSKTDKVKIVDITQNIVLQDDGITYAGTGEITVSYTPTASNIYEDINVQLRAEYNTGSDVILDAFTIHARSLPEEFVIVAKSGDKWYALNGDMSNSSSANPANGQVTLDSDANPTKATYAPCNAIYTFDGVPNTGDRTRVRFQGTDGAWLWASSGTNVGIQNKSLKDTPEGNNNAYNWKIETEDNITYKFHNDNNSRLLGLNGEKFGMYASGVQEFRILPYVEKCLYNYAPTNLKVSVLKGTSVTLTWDAVAGATKYQYSTDATNWTDAGTEPTVTINGLKKDTDYIYYIRAYHEDAGVSQECIDYAVITFTTADCDDVPADITYSADLTSITVTWTAVSTNCTVRLYSDEACTSVVKFADELKGSVTFSQLDRNTTYYVRVFAEGTCASPIVPVKTEDVEVDIVEWYPQGIIVDINTDETVGVTLENEVSYGSGLGTEATELFFSKYYEASYNVKLVAIYNGTKNIIDLADYIIKYGKTSWETNYITLKDFGATKGQIQPGEEIILYSYTENNADDKKILDCVHEKFPDGDWVRVTSSNNTGKGILSFAGDKTLALFKGKNIIDIIGAVNGSNPNNSKANKRPSWGDDNGWNCATGLSLADDSKIGISTNRCLLVRNNTVTSGANAVASNTTDFVTLCSEWKGAHVLDSDVDNGINESCENFAYVGNFDYSDYYTKYETMGDEQVFDKNDRKPDGTVTIPITNLYKQSCRNIRIKLSNSNGDVLTDREYKVPIMITTTQGTDGQAFLDLQQNLATVEVNDEGNVINTYPLSLDEVREICKTCDVVVRDNATLTKVTDGTDNDHPQVRNVYVYEGASIVIPDGDNHNYTINGLSLRRKGDVVASAQVQGTGKFVLPADEPVCLDLRVDANNWHWFTLPFDCLIEDVTWVDGTPAKYNTDWFLMYYDGESRAASTNPYDNHWKVYNGTTIEAGKGYIVGITGDLTHPNYTFELRFPMAQDVLTAEQTRKTVPVNAWGVKSDNKPNNLGWNLVGNPYLNYYKTAAEYSPLAGLPLIKYTSSDLVVGEFYEEENGNIPFLVTPIDGGWYEYRQELASEVNMMPFTAYFVQVGDPNTHTNGQALNASFEASNRGKKSIVRRAPHEVEEKEEPIIVRVELTNSKGESDKTSLVIDDRFTNEYEMQADFFKWFGDYYNYYTKPVLYTIGADQGKRAFNALNEELAKQPIPMGMYAAQAGNYTFSLNQQFDLSRVEEVWLYDATQSTYTNLMQSDYTFSTSKVNGAGRFSLSVKLAPKVATSIDNVTADKVWATTHTKQVIVNGLENGMHLWLYDATGKLLYNEPTSNYQHTYAVPQTGTYFVSVMKGNAKQTIKVVVE